MKRLLICGASALAFPAAAFAQAAPVQQSAAEQGIGEIVVTAQRRAESAQRAALAIEAIGAEDLQRAGVSRPEDIAKLATGVHIGTGGNVPQIYIRGVGNYATNSNAEGAIAVNVDGVYVSRPWGIRGTFFDLERIEALKGPQGTLYGRNASGGAINLITRKPRLGETSGYVELNAGNYDLLSAEAAVNLPLSETVAIRVSGKTITRNGYLKDGYDDEHGQSARAHLLFEPSDALSVLLSTFYQKEYGQGAGMTMMSPRTAPAGAPAYNVWGGPTQPLFRYLEFQNNPAGSPIASPVPGTVTIPGVGTIPFFQAPNANGFNRNEVYGFSGELNWDFGGATLTVLPAYRYGKHSNLMNVAEYQIIEYETDKQTSLEARLSNQSDRLKWVLGGYYFNETQGNQDGHNLRQSQANFSGDEVLNFDANTRSYAAFGQATFSLTDAFRVTGGLRYTYERKRVNADQLSYAGFVQGSFPPVCDASHQAPLPSPLPLAPCVGEVNNDGRISSDSVTWKAGVEFDVAPRSLLYASVSTGFKSGGLYSAPAPNSFRPEKLTAYEIGSKNRFFNNKVQANIELFYYDYKDHQEAYLGPTSDPNIFTFVTANAGKAESYGALLDLQFQPTKADRFGVAVQYNKSKYKSYDYTSPIFFPPNTTCAVTPFSNANGDFAINCAGKPIVRAPEWSGNAYYNHDFTLANGGTIGVGGYVQFSSSYFTSIEFLDSQKQGGFALLDADITYTSPDGRFSVALWGRNLTNQAVFTSTFHSPFVINNATGPEGVNVGTLKPPRTYGIRTRLNF